MADNILNMPNAKMIEASDEVRVRKCLQQIQVILDSFDCIIVPRFQIIGDQISNDVSIVAKPRNVVPPNQGVN